MSSYQDFANTLMESLKLAAMPVAVSFVDEVAATDPRPQQVVAAGCQYWEIGSAATVVTDAGDHKHCSIGIHTHQLQDAPAAQNDELSTTLAAMQGLDYVREEEVAGIPVLNAKPAGVRYGPLAECESDPATVLLFANAAQGLIIVEAIARVDGAAPAALGRPACALVPAVVNSGQAASSLGCCGARAYIGSFNDDTTVWALAGARLAEYVTEIETLAKANKMLSRFHELRNQDIAAGSEPTVKDSLARLESA